MKRIYYINAMTLGRWYMLTPKEELASGITGLWQLQRLEPPSDMIFYGHSGQWEIGSFNSIFEITAE